MFRLQLLVQLYVQEVVSCVPDLKMCRQDDSVLMDVMSMMQVAGPKPGEKINDYWEPGRALLQNPDHFLSSLMNFDKEAITDIIILKLKPYIENPNFEPSRIITVNDRVLHGSVPYKEHDEKSWSGHLHEVPTGQLRTVGLEKCAEGEAAKFGEIEKVLGKKERRFEEMIVWRLSS
uniref:Dynein heavy chain coiled coil stalk domain-containing protein n=1 Tax=Timema genevievae TaxID=629358 RepID=A0A7R9PQF9_TIMGE|nr:unnamed protein product [Timema genevievae]